MDMLRDTLKNFNIENIGWESAIISRILKGGMKEAVIHAVNNTVEPVIYGTLETPVELLGLEEESVADEAAEALEASVTVETVELAPEGKDTVNEEITEEIE